MKRFRNMLVHYGDRSASTMTLRRAAALVRETGARLTVGHVVAAEPAFTWTAGYGRDRMRTSRHREHQHLVEEAAGGLLRRGVVAGARLMLGDTVDALVEEARRAGHDLVVKAAGVGVSQEMENLAAPDVELLRRLPCALWLVRQGDPARTVLAAVDPEHGGDEHHPMNRTILETAASMAALDGAAFHVVHASPRRESARPEAVATERARREHRLSSAQGELRALVAAALGPQAPPDDGVIVVDGDPGRLVPEHARRIGADLLVLGTTAHTDGTLMGRSATVILPSLRCGVLGVRPDTPRI